MLKLEIVRSECIACESCATVCPDLFMMADDGQASLKSGKRVGDNDELQLQDEGCAREAAESCPVSCIHVYRDGEKLL